jgi:hypothetical protein
MIVRITLTHDLKNVMIKAKANSKPAVTKSDCINSFVPLFCCDHSFKCSVAGAVLEASAAHFWFFDQARL